jgi:hypothetical protein
MSWAFRNQLGRQVNCETLWCYRTIQTVHAIFHKDGKLIARAKKGDRTGYYEFEIVEFELIGPGERHK